MLRVVLFLLTVFFNFYQFLILSRFILQCVKADFNHPFCQFVLRTTNPLVLPTRKWIKSWQGLDLATLALFYGVVWVQTSLFMLLALGTWSGFSFISALFQALHFYLSFMFFSILIYALMTWFTNAQMHPLGSLLHQMVEPLLRRLRQIVPLIAGWDLSPLFALILIQVLNMILPG